MASSPRKGGWILRLRDEREVRFPSIWPRLSEGSWVGRPQEGDMARPQALGWDSCIPGKGPALRADSGAFLIVMEFLGCFRVELDIWEGSRLPGLQWTPRTLQDHITESPLPSWALENAAVKPQA